MIMIVIAKKPTTDLTIWAHSIGTGYPLKGCSSAEPSSVSPDPVKIAEIKG
jgi:hypothetical protein